MSKDYLPEEKKKNPKTKANATLRSLEIQLAASIDSLHPDLYYQLECRPRNYATSRTRKLDLAVLFVSLALIITIIIISRLKYAPPSDETQTVKRSQSQRLNIIAPLMPPFDEAKFEPMPEVEIDPLDEFHVGKNEAES
ncbi:MAG TPA: hypothetical protein VGC91_21315 [Pyrinomonadaceae bacterium]